MNRNNFNDDFDRHFKRTTKAIVGIVIATAISSLVILSLIVWAVVTLVKHFTGA